MSTIKKTTSFLAFFILLGTSTIFAQEKQKVSKNELTQFAGIFEKLQAANDKAQQKMVQVVESEGLEMKRFNEIHIAYVNPNIDTDATPEELKKHHSAMNKIQKMQEELQRKMDSIVKESGWTTKEYQKIATAMEDDLSLRERYKEIMKAE